MKKIYLATDHAGFELKEKLKDFLEKECDNFTIEDCGAYAYNSLDDYPDFISKAAENVSKSWNNSNDNSKKDLAIVFGGSGQGEAMMANKFDNVRATVYYKENEDIIKLSKVHNNANILSIGARFFNNKKDIKKLFNDVTRWIKIDFSEEERHKRRINKMNEFFKYSCLLSSNHKCNKDNNKDIN